MAKKYRVTSNDDQYIVYAYSDGSKSIIEVHFCEKVVNKMTCAKSELSDEDVESALKLMLGDNYIFVEKWQPYTVQFDFSDTVSISFNAFEDDNIYELAERLLMTSFKERVIEGYRDSLTKSPYIEAGYYEPGINGHYFSDDHIKAWLSEEE